MSSFYSKNIILSFNSSLELENYKNTLSFRYCYLQTRHEVNIILIESYLFYPIIFPVDYL